MLHGNEIQEWEWDFLPNPATNVCAQCGQVHIAEMSTEKEVWDGQQSVMYLFCSTLCSHEFYLARLREQF